jgi:hypothetical protein
MSIKIADSSAARKSLFMNILHRTRRISGDGPQFPGARWRHIAKFEVRKNKDGALFSAPSLLIPPVGEEEKFDLRRKPADGLCHARSPLARLL